MVRPQDRLSIRDVIKELGISRKTYFNWEQLKKIPPARRDPMSNHRLFTKEDISKLKKLTGRD